VRRTWQPENGKALGFLDISVLQSFTTQSLATFILLAFVGLIAASIVYGEIRILTDSVWPAVLMHTVGNAFINTLLLQDFIKMARGMESLVTPGHEGVLSLVLYTLVGVGIHLLRSKRRTAA
jgi:membrane protease YdiL (CAAX protease family)